MNLRAEHARSDTGQVTPQQRLLLRLAARHRLRSVVHARGRCFSVSLDLALDAHKRGLAVTLLRWRVVGEDDFVDHWAVRFDDAQALDLSSVQFDPAGRLLQPIGLYPEQFVERREYPASLFLPTYACVALHRRGRLPLSFLSAVCTAMWRHDLGSALRRGALLHAAGVCLRYAARRLVLGIERWRRSLERRERRLRGEPPTGQTIL